MAGAMLRMGSRMTLEWANVEAKLETNTEKLWSLNEMERTGGEPDVVGHDKKTGEYIFYDCSPESPNGRRSVCYDREALESRKEHKPQDNAIDMAAAMGIELLSDEQYRELQKLGNFDTKTSSWVKHLLISENSVALSFTTVPNLTMPPGRSVAC
jgi:Protein of unknown function (DUF4256)